MKSYTIRKTADGRYDVLRNGAVIGHLDIHRSGYLDWSFAVGAAPSPRTCTRLAQDAKEEPAKPCECVYEASGHREGDGECPYGPDTTTAHPDGVTRYVAR